MSSDGTRLKRFLTDQEEAVQLARAMPEGSCPSKIDAINAALSLAHTNAQSASKVTTMAEIIKDAVAAEKYLSGTS